MCRHQWSSDPYLVTADAIAEFARAIGETDLICHDIGVARARGASAVVAPPTFPIVVAGEPLLRAVNELAGDGAAVLHNSQEFDYRRQLCAGETVVCDLRVENNVARGRDTLLTLAGGVRTDVGELVVTMRVALVLRSAPEAEAEAAGARTG